MANLTIFVAGIHGSGKSTLCQEICPYLNAQHVTASSLIARGKVPQGGKAVSGIADNQNILVSEFKDFSRNFPKILLDGHFCLLNKSGGVERLPLAVFSQLGIAEILVVTSDPPLIYERLLQRDGSTHQLSVAAIKSFQQAELEHAHYIAKELDLRLFEIDGADKNAAFASAIGFLNEENRGAS